jgi:hypothetical protein
MFGVMNLIMNKQTRNLLYKNGFRVDKETTLWPSLKQTKKYKIWIEPTTDDTWLITVLEKKTGLKVEREAPDCCDLIEDLKKYKNLDKVELIKEVEEWCW